MPQPLVHRLLAAAAAALIPCTAGAQEPPAADTVELEPIVVTVLRSPVRLDRMPFSTSVLAGAEMAPEGRSGLFIEEALHGLAGVRVQNRYNASVGERISIRGFGARSQFGVRGIKVLVDGIPATLPDGQTTLDHLDVGALGRVEALRGPAAALYGNGAGGVILFESAAAAPGSSESSLTLAGGSNGMLRVQATGSAAREGLSYRWSTSYGRYEGFRNNAGSSGADPYSRSTRANLNGSVDFPVAGGVLGLGFTAVGLDALNPGSLPAGLFDEGSNQAWGFNVARGTRKDVRQGQAGARWRGRVGGGAGGEGGMEAVISAYGVRRELDNPIPSSYIDLARNGGGARLALARDWDAPSGAARIAFGAEGELQGDDRLNHANEGGERGVLTRDQQENVRAAALFGQILYPFTDRLGAMGAVRFDHFRFSAHDRFITPDNPDDTGTRTMAGISPSLGLHLDLGGHGLFASVARSLETPTTTELANQPDRAGGFNPDLEPQHGWTFEAGVRGDPGARVAYDLAAFAASVTNQLVPFEVPNAPGRRFYRNAGRSRVRGIEASARAALSQVFTASVSYGYVDARFTEFSARGEDYADNRVPGIAPHRVEGSLRAAGGAWFAEARVERRGEVPANDANDASAQGFTLFDLRAGAGAVRAWGRTFTPFAGLTNLTNARYASSVVVNAFGGRYFEPGPARGGYVGLTVARGR